MRSLSEEVTIVPANEVSLQQQILKDFITTLPDCKQSFPVSSLCTSYFSLEKISFIISYLSSHYCQRYKILYFICYTTT